jgi:hypothetical protein
MDLGIACSSPNVGQEKVAGIMLSFVKRAVNPVSFKTARNLYSKLKIVKFISKKTGFFFQRRLF